MAALLFHFALIAGVSALVLLYVMKRRLDISESIQLREAPLPDVDELRKLWCFDRNLLDNPRTEHTDYPEYTKGIAWVSDKYKVLYLQTPKCASSSISSVLWQMNGSFVAKHLFQDPPDKRQRYRDYFTFTFVRDPIRRFASGYYTIQGRPAKDLCRITNGTKDMDLFWETLPRDTPETFQHIISRLIAEDVDCWTVHHTFPQTFFTSDMAGLPFRLDFVGRQKSLKDDWERLREMVPHVPFPPMDMYHHNVAEGQAKEGNSTKNRLLDWLLTDESAVPTLRLLCKYLRSDYMCFDFDFPEACKDLAHAASGEEENSGTTSWAGPLWMSRSEEIRRIFERS